MFDFYPLDIIPTILENFKVKNVLLLGLHDKKLVNEILSYDASFTGVDLNESSQVIDVINDYPLNVLSEIEGYDAVFIDDDPNWYTIFNELSIINKSNDEFPLVFVCNNRFPHKYRDTYFNPEIIPEEFRHDYLKELPVNYNDERIVIYDDNYHACEEHTPRNGVSSAIEDFINENSNIGVMDIQFFEGISILYVKNTISKIRIDKIKNAIQNKNISDYEFSDRLIENQVLFSFINEFDVGEGGVIDSFQSELSKKDDSIKDYENKIQIHDTEIKYRESKIDNLASKLDLKDSQIKNFESILENKESEIDNLKVQFDEKSKKVNDLNSQLLFADNKINSIQNDLTESENSFESLKKEHTYQRSQLTSKEYCITCFKDEISNNRAEIDYLENNSFTRKIMSPFAYAYLFLKSLPNDVSLNFKLFKALRDSKCFNKGFYLDNNKDLLNSKWCKYFSPELHYVCNGFSENRKFNKKYYNTNSKKDLLEYIAKCVDEE